MGESSYEIDVRSILTDLGGTLQLDADVAIPVLTLGAEEFAPVAPGHLEATVTNTGAGIVAAGTVQVDARAECSRCLRPFVLRVTGDLEGFYVAPGAEADLPDEQEYGFVREGSIDIMDAALAALALELPFAPVHATDCAGICPTCGADLNEATCSCPPAESTSPFAALKTLLPEDGRDR